VIEEDEREGDTYSQADVFELRPLVLGPLHDDIALLGLVVDIDHLLRGDVEVLPWRRGDVLRDTQKPNDELLSRLGGFLGGGLWRWGSDGDVGLQGRLRHRVYAGRGVRAVHCSDDYSIVYFTYL